MNQVYRLNENGKIKNNIALDVFDGRWWINSILWNECGIAYCHGIAVFWYSGILVFWNSGVLVFCYSDFGFWYYVNSIRKIRWQKKSFIFVL